MIRKRSAGNSSRSSKGLPGHSKVLPCRPKDSSDQVGSTESVVSAGSDHDDVATEPTGYTTPVTRKRRRLSMSPEVNHAPTDEVKEEMQCLLDYVPKLRDLFTVVNKIGEGTFSSVYLAKILGHRGGTLDQMYAIKHIIPTSHPDRILTELNCLTAIGGQDNVIGVKLCLRERDHVILAMPYHPHQKFQDYVRDMPISEVKEYMYNLLLALRRVHQYNVIHRDVKPSNFLYNRKTKRYALVDFGLAQKVSQAASRLQQSYSTPPARGRASVKSESEGRLHSRTSSLQESQGSVNRRTRRIASAVENQTSSPLILSHQKKPAVKPSPRLSELSINTFQTKTPTKDDIPEKKKLFRSPRTMMAQKLIMSKQLHHTQALSLTKSKKVTEHEVTVRPRSASLTRISLQSKGTCHCFGQPQVCSLCMGRSNQQAPRAGTPGFRAPEVLLKHPHQTTAVDMWAAGVILLSILSGRYPFFKAQDDMTAIMQIMSIFGSDAMTHAASRYGKNLLSGIRLPALNLKHMCEQLRNPQIDESPKRRRRSHSSERSSSQESSSTRKQRSPKGKPLSPPTEGGRSRRRDSSSPADRKQGGDRNFPDSAYDLLARLLELDPARRISAEEALRHPFLADVKVSKY